MLSCGHLRRSLLPALRCCLDGGRAARRSTVAASQESASEGKPFSAIPGPGNPLASTLSVFRARHRLHEFFRDRHAQYGPIYKEWLGPTPAVVISDPDSVAQVLRQDGKYPFRLDIPILKTYRELKNEAPGIVLMEGEDWYRVRRVVNQPMMRIKNVAQYLGAFHSVAEELVDILARKRDSQGVVPNLEEELFKWSLETACCLLYDKRQGCLDEQPEPEMAEFIKAAEHGADSLNILVFLSSRLARLAFPKLVKRFFQCQDVMIEYTRKCIDEKIRELTWRGRRQEGVVGEVGVVEYMLSSPDITLKEVYGNITDIMAAAIDTTSNSSLCVLHQLAAHPQVQQRLYDDVTTVLPPGQPPTYNSLQQLPLLKAVIKETMRLFPVASSLTRVLQNDAVVQGFKIPKDTMVMMSLYTMGRQETIFPDAERFNPDRWFRGRGAKEMHPFAFIPFGFGTRMCVGQRIAQLEMQLLLTEILRRFRLEPVDSEPLQLKTAFLTVPAKSVRLRLISR